MPSSLAAQPVAPSAIAVAVAGAFGTPRALLEPEILAIIARYARTAEVAKKAGFTGVEIHGAHGYLISQFLSPLSNVRKDDWGGTLENRMRFLLEIVRATRALVGEGIDLLEISGGTYEKPVFA